MIHKRLNYIVAILLAISLTYTNAQASDNSNFDDCHVVNKIWILDRRPEYFWDDQKKMLEWGYFEGMNPKISQGNYQVKSAAGVFPYIIYKDVIYILLARESWGIDKGTYCDLGGAVEMSDFYPDIPETFLMTLLKEGNEESGGLYTFSREQILEKAHILSYTYTTDGFYKGFETVLAFCPVEDFYSHEDFLRESSIHVKKLQEKNLCPWSFQEKDDYQWVELKSLYDALSGIVHEPILLRNIYNEEIRIKLRPSLLEILKSFDTIALLNSILAEQAAF